jgi:3D-(3,5/4)-trihydroxycyclohexane-1,2-dione acylhydrolase (decyclizing)
LQKLRRATKATLIHITSDPLLYSPNGEGWWDVPIAKVSTLKSTQDALAKYEKDIKNQKYLFGKGAIERN